MQYIKEIERRKLFEKFSTMQDLSTITAVVDFTVETIDSLFKNCKVPLFESKDCEIILKLLIENKEEEILDFIHEMQTRAGILNLQEERLNMQNNINNLRALLNGEVEKLYDLSKLSNEAKAKFVEQITIAIREHVNDLVTELQQDKKHRIEILYQAVLDDVKYLEKGERVPVEESGTYKVLRKIHDGTLK